MGDTGKQNEYSAKKNYSHIQKQLPQNGKHNTLQSIRDIPCNKAPSKEPKPTIRCHDRHCGVNISDASLVDLAISFDDTQGIGYRIGNDRSAKTYKGLADNFFT